MNEQDIPIEIIATKLLDWLESRKIVGKMWKTQIKDVRIKISNALNDMPEHKDLVKLLSGEYINYYHCLQIVDILKTTEADTRTLFGRYGSQRMTDWLQIEKLYEKESIYLAEAAQIYQQCNTNVPGLRRQRLKMTQLIDEAQQRVRDSIKSEENAVAERMAVCQQLGITGVNLKAEFLARIKELPKLYDDIAGKIPRLNKAIKIYLDFAENSELLPLLRHLELYGNTTVYQFVYNEVPIAVEEPSVQIKISPENDINPVDNEIDFNIDSIDFPGTDNGDDVIDFSDIDIVDITVESESIDWNDVTVENGVDSGIVTAISGNRDNGIAKGDEALTILDNSTYRDQFLDELYELDSFLLMRQHELKSEESNSFVFSIIEKNSKHDLNDVELMLRNVQDIQLAWSNDVIDHLHRLKHSPMYADTLAGKLRQHLLAAEKMAATQSIVKDKIEQLRTDREALRPLIAKLIDHSKVLQKHIEQDISKRYKGRPVFVYGGVEADPLD